MFGESGQYLGLDHRRPEKDNKCNSKEADGVAVVRNAYYLQPLTSTDSPTHGRKHANHNLSVSEQVCAAVPVPAVRSWYQSGKSADSDNFGDMQYTHHQPLQLLLKSPSHDIEQRESSVRKCGASRPYDDDEGTVEVKADIDGYTHTRTTHVRGAQNALSSSLWFEASAVAVSSHNDASQKMPKKLFQPSPEAVRVPTSSNQCACTDTDKGTGMEQPQLTPWTALEAKNRETGNSVDPSAISSSSATNTGSAESTLTLSPPASLRLSPATLEHLPMRPFISVTVSVKSPSSSRTPHHVAAVASVEAEDIEDVEHQYDEDGQPIWNSSSNSSSRYSTRKTLESTSKIDNLKQRPGLATNSIHSNGSNAYPYPAHPALPVSTSGFSPSLQRPSSVGKIPPFISSSPTTAQNSGSRRKILTLAPIKRSTSGSDLSSSGFEDINTAVDDADADITTPSSKDHRTVSYIDGCKASIAATAAAASRHCSDDDCWDCQPTAVRVSCIALTLPPPLPASPSSIARSTGVCPVLPTLLETDRTFLDMAPCRSELGPRGNHCLSHSSKRLQINTTMVTATMATAMADELPVPTPGQVSGSQSASGVVHRPRCYGSSSSTHTQSTDNNIPKMPIDISSPATLGRKAILPPVNVPASAKYASPSCNSSHDQVDTSTTAIPNHKAHNTSTTPLAISVQLNNGLSQKNILSGSPSTQAPYSTAAAAVAGTCTCGGSRSSHFSAVSSGGSSSPSTPWPCDELVWSTADMLRTSRKLLADTYEDDRHSNCLTTHDESVEAP